MYLHITQTARFPRMGTDRLSVTSLRHCPRDPVSCGSATKSDRVVGLGGSRSAAAACAGADARVGVCAGAGTCLVVGVGTGL